MATSPLAGRRILLVEDETALSMMMEDMLEEIGCIVAAAVAKPAHALQAIEDNEIDAAILDVNLGGEDSFAVAAKLAERGIPFLFSTGYGPKGLREEFQARPVLTKPFRLPELRQGLQSIIANGAA